MTAAGAQAATRPAGAGTGWSAAATGQRSAAPSSASRAATLKDLTGLSASQVTTRDACTSPGPGYAACQAHVDVLRSTGRLIHPHVAAQRAVAGGTPGLPRTVGNPSSGQSAPDPGTPAYLQQAYDLSWLSAYHGSADTIAVIDAYGDPTAEADLSTFRAQYGLPACTTADGCFRAVNQSGQASPLPPASPGSGWVMEESLDLDAISALCPNCNIILVEANSASTTDLRTAMQAGVNLGANQLSNSWSVDQSRAPSGQFTWPGVSTIAATGDNGYLGTRNDAFPAALPGVTAAGATTLAAATSGARGFDESGWSGAGSGCDTAEAKPSFQADTGCSGRSYADLSADGDPNTGLNVYDSADGGWLVVGGTSLATPLIAAYEAVTGVSGNTPAWAYGDAALLNDPVSGSNGSCAAAISYICNAASGYDGPTGIGSISGQVATGGPGIGGPAQANGYVQWATETTASVAGGVYPNSTATTYQWQYGTTQSYGQTTPGADIGSGAAPVAVTDTLTGLTAGTTYHYRLVASSNAGTTYGYDYTFTTPTRPAPPVNAQLPSITGTAGEGQTLSASPGTWSPAGAVSYKWQRNAGSGWQPIAGATAATYTTVPADVGAQLEVTVTETNPDGIASASSSPSATVSSGGPAVSAAPQISGISNPGGTLSVSAGFDPSGALSYQWRRSTDGGVTWTAIGGATTAAYTPAVSDGDALIEVTVTAVNAYGSVSATSPAVQITPITPADPVAPSITGVAQTGQTLSANPGSWTPGGTIAYQWQRNAGNGWQPVAGATAPTYALGSADLGATLRVVVTDTAYGAAAGAASNALGPVSSPAPPSSTSPSPAPVILGGPWLSGAARVGGVVTVAGGNYRDGSVSVVQFERCARRCTVIARGRSASYTLTGADAGDYIRALVTVAGPGGSITTWAAGSIGPVRSRTAGAAGYRPGGRSVIRGLRGRALARVSAGARATRAQADLAGAARGQRATRQTISFSRPAGAAGPISVWACLVRRGTVVSCTASRSLRSRISVRLTSAPGESVELIAVAGR